MLTLTWNPLMLRKKITFGGKSMEGEGSGYLIGRFHFCFLMVPYMYLSIYLAMFIEHLLWPGLVSGIEGKIDSAAVLKRFIAHRTDSR